MSRGDALLFPGGTELERSDEVKLTAAERVARAGDWVIKHIAPEPSFALYIRLGYTCYYLEDDATAIQYYEKALRFPDDSPWRALVAMGRAHESLKSLDKAIACFNEALEAARPLYEANRLEEVDTTLFQKVLKEFAELYSQSQQMEKAIPLREEALRVKPSDVECRFDLLESLCKTGQVQHAIELLEDWEARAENYGGKRPSDSFYALLDQPDASSYHIVQFVRNINDEALRNMLINALTDAITLAKKESRNAIVASLLCIQATAMAWSSDPNTALAAIELWEEALQIQIPVDGKTWEYRDSIEAASRAISKRKFDSTRAKLTFDAEIPQQAKEKMRQELKNYIEYVAKAYSDNSFHASIDQVDRYIASWCFLAKMEQRGREVCSFELKTALEILSDDDEANDGEGIGLLLDILSCQGDKVGALTAWSLLDKRSRAKKGSTELAHQDQPTNGRNEWQPKSDDCLIAFCDICSELMESSTPEGIWYCRFCPRTPLCRNCILKLQNRELDVLRMDVCSPEHEFWHFYHTDYTPEEIAPGKVRIEWELQELGDGKFERKGGRVVDLKDWIDQLRVNWELPALDIESHAQK